MGQQKQGSELLLEPANHKAASFGRAAQIPRWGSLWSDARTAADANYGGLKFWTDPTTPGKATKRNEMCAFVYAPISPGETPEDGERTGT